MQDKHVFEYAFIRVVPRVERGEFMNVGVILFCKSLRFLDMRYLVREQRLTALYADIDFGELRCQLDAFARICRGDASGGAIAALDLPSRFRWLTAKRSTMLQTSEVHPGLCTAPEAILEKLFAELADS